MTEPLQDVNYDKKQFNFSASELRHPRCITERFFVYHLVEEDRGVLACKVDPQGNAVMSPRFVIFDSLLSCTCK